MITSTDPALWTRAPATGFRIPAMASIMAVKFKIIDKGNICRIYRDDTTYSAHCYAYMVFFSAGASLMPSPIIHTIFLFFWRKVM